MRVLFADRLDPVAERTLTEAGWEVVSEPALRGDALTARLSDLNPAALVVRSTRVTAADAAAAPALGLVIRAGAGVNTIDLEACSDRGIVVANCPGKNAIAVAELVFGLMIALDRSLVAAATDARQGQWKKSEHARGAKGLHGRTLGIIGLGMIGEAVAWRARGFGMHVQAWSRSLDPKRARLLGLTYCDTPVEAARGADVLSVHLAATPDTRELVGSDVFAAMQPDGLFLNAARHEVVDEDALLTAVRGGLRAGLDVLSAEPKGDTAFSHPLASEPGVVISPHLGASTLQASEAVAEEVARLLEQWRHSGRVDAAVNVAAHHGVDGTLVVRHLDRVGVLAAVLEQLRAAQVNVEEMENTVLLGRRGAIARISVAGSVDDALLSRVEALDHVLAAGYTRA